jgi:hypothetical protein
MLKRMVHIVTTGLQRIKQMISKNQTPVSCITNTHKPYMGYTDLYAATGWPSLRPRSHMLIELIYQAGNRPSTARIKTMAPSKTVWKQKSITFLDVIPYIPVHTCRRNILPPSSESKNKPSMTQARSRMPVEVYRTTRRHIPFFLLLLAFSPEAMGKLSLSLTN